MDGARLRLRIIGDAGGAWQAIHAAGRWQLCRDEPSAVDATLTVDQDVAWRLFTRGISVAQAWPNVSLDGDQRLAATALEMVAIIA